MDLKDPQVRKALRLYEQQFVAERRREELQRRVTDQTILQKLLAPVELPPARPVTPAPAWLKLLIQPEPPRPQPALGRNLEKLDQVNKFLSGIFDTVNAFDKAAMPIVKALVEGLRPVGDLMRSAGSFLDKLPEFTSPLLEEILEAIRRHREAVAAGTPCSKPPTTGSQITCGMGYTSRVSPT